MGDSAEHFLARTVGTPVDPERNTGVSVGGKDGMRLGRRAQERFGQRRLPDACLARDQDELSRPLAERDGGLSCSFAISGSRPTKVPVDEKVRAFEIAQHAVPGIHPGVERAAAGSGRAAREVEYGRSHEGRVVPW